MTWRAFVLTGTLVLTPALAPAALVAQRTAGVAQRTADIAQHAADASQHTADPLTLEEALRRARAANPAFLRTANDLDVAAAAVRSAWAGFLPTLNTSISFSGSRSTRITGEDDFGNPVRLAESIDFRSSSTSQSLSSAITLFDGGSTLHNLRGQRAAHAAVEAQIEQQALQLTGQVSREFYAAVRAVRTISLEEQLLASARDRLERTEALMALAARNRVDVLGAQADVAQAEQNVERARGEAEKARLTLAATLGMEPGAAFAVDTALPRIADPAALDAGELVAAARSTSPLVRQREAALRVAAHRADAARGRRWPSVSANVSYGRSMGLRSYEAFRQLNPQNSALSFGFGASLPLFSRFQSSAQILEASAAEHDATHDLRAAELNLEREVRSALIDLVNAHRSLQLAELRVELGRERLELAQEQYRLGGINFTELQNLIDRTAEAERQAVEARFGFISARLLLEERIGRPLEG